MKYKLKDKELEDSLNKLVCNFDESFQNDCTKQYDGYLDFVRVYLTDSPITSISINKSDIYKCPEYDPNTWNEYPEVTPPEGVLMRVEAGVGVDRRYIKSCAVYVDGVWCEPNRERSPSVIGDCVTRFRPWEDD